MLDFSNPQLYNTVYMPLLHDNNRFKILYGGRDSGKSDFVAQAFIIRMLKEQFVRGILLRQHYASIEQSQFQTIIDYIHLWQLSEHFHVTTRPLSIKCKLNGNLLLARGLDKPDKTKSIKDPTLIWYEEADQITEASFTESSLSLRSSQDDVRLEEWITFNPRNESSWINKKFFPVKNSYERADGNFHFVKSIYPETTILHTNYTDNEFIKKARIKRLLSLQYEDDNYYKVNTLGLWGGALKGLIYTDWTAVDELPTGGDDIFALDYGYNNPTALLHIVYYENELYIKELLYETELDHTDVVKRFRALSDVLRNKLIIADSAAPELIKLLRKSGFNAIPAAKGSGSVKDGIIFVKQFKLNIVKSSINTIDEIRAYKWKEDRDGNAIDEPVKVDDHAMDAMRYGVHTYGKKHWQVLNKITGDTTYKRKKQKDVYSNY